MGEGQVVKHEKRIENETEVIDKQQIEMVKLQQACKIKDGIIKRLKLYIKEEDEQRQDDSVRILQLEQELDEKQGMLSCAWENVDKLKEELERTQESLKIWKDKYKEARE